MPDRILITGAAGFIGSNLARYILANTDWDVVSLDRLDEAGALQAIVDLKQSYCDRVTSIWHDLKSPINPAQRSLEPLRRPFRYIAHLAAGSHVDRSIRDPLLFLHDNVIGTANLLEYVRHHQSPEKTLVFGTDEIYGAADHNESFDEYDRWHPTNPYAASKCGSEALCPAWANTYGMPIVATHCTNVMGENQHVEKFIPIAIERISAGLTLQIHARAGVPSSRCYVHVDNVSSAVLTILERGTVIGGPGTGVYNISGADDVSNLAVAQRIAELLGKPLHYELVENVVNRPRPDMRYAISDARLRALGWAPHVSFDEGLRRIVALSTQHVSMSDRPEPSESSVGQLRTA